MVSIQLKFRPGRYPLQIKWNEPGKADASVSFDVWIHNAGQDRGQLPGAPTVLLADGVAHAVTPDNNGSD
jgi:hypothetical protein